MRRGFAFLSILLLLAVLIACNSNPGNRELIVCIDNAVAGKGAKTIAYDGSLTDGNTDINAYRILVSGGDMSLDTGWQMTDEFLLADVLSGTYSFTVQGAVASDDLSAVYPVAEDLYEIAVDGNPVFLELKSIIPGLCPYIELRFYLPYGFHENDVVDFTFGPVDMEYADGSVYENAFAHWNLQPLEGDVYTARADENGRLYIDARTRSEGVNTVYPPAGIYMLTLPVTFSNADGQEYKSTASSMVVGYQGLVASGSFDFSIGEELWEPVFEFDSQNNTVAIMNIEKDDTHNAFITRHDAAGDLGYWFNIIDKEHSSLPLSLDEYGDSVLNTISIMTMDGESYSSEFMPSAGTLGLIPDGWLSDDGKHITHCYSGPAVNPYEEYSQGINEISDILILDIEGERPSLRKHFSDNLFAMAGSDPYDIFVDPGIDKPYFSDDGEGDGELHLPANSLITLSARRMAYVPDDSTDNIAIISASSQIGQITIETDSSRAWLPLPAPEFTVSRQGINEAVIKLSNWEEYPDDTILIVNTAYELSREHDIEEYITIAVDDDSQGVSAYALYQGIKPYEKQSETTSVICGPYQIPTPSILSATRGAAEITCRIGNTVEGASYYYKIGEAPASPSDGVLITDNTFKFSSFKQTTVFVKGFMSNGGSIPSEATQRTISAFANDIWSIAYGNGMFLATTDNYILKSYDGITWFDEPESAFLIERPEGPEAGGAGNRNHFFYRKYGVLSFQNDRFILSDQYASYTMDGHNWVVPPAASHNGVDEFIYFRNGEWISAASYGSYHLTIFITTDFYSWERIHFTDLDYYSAPDQNSLLNVNGKLLGINGHQNGQDFVMYSTDARNWNFVDKPMPTDVNKLVYGNGEYIAYIADGAGSSLGGYTVPPGEPVYKSRDGITWTEIEDSDFDDVLLNQICYGNGKFVAVGTDGDILYGTSNIWNKTSSGVDTDIKSVAYGNGIYVAVGDSGVVLTSLNGIDWNRL